VVGVGALWSPNTGIVDFGAVAAALKQQFLAAGGELQLGVEVASICTGPGSPRLSFSEAEPIEVGHALVCAGAWSHRLLDDADLRIVPFKGTYLNLKGHRSRAVRSMIYPVPDPALPFLGVHLTPTIDGRLTIGPTARLAAARGYGRVSARDLLDTVAWPGTPRLMARHWRSGIDELRMAVSRRSIVARAAAYVPSLSLDDIEPGGWHGVRAQAVARDGSLVDDFVFSQTGRVLHVLNAPSPAATSALAIARHVADRFDAAFN
jgi:2-hydroxyglutarate dehydrogenase